MKSFFPILNWLPKYKKKYFFYDFLAGINVGIILIPQGMAYALIAGLPPIYGLYAALVPQIVYAVLGTSRQLAVGPVAIDSLIVASSLGIMAFSNPEEYILMAISLAFIVGSFQLIMASFKLSFIVTFLSKPIISGFVSAIAIIIGFSQLKFLFGISISESNLIKDVLLNVINSIDKINIPTLCLGLFSILIIIFIKKKTPKFPIYFVMLISGIVISYLFNLNKIGIDILGNIPKGLPEFKIPILTYDTITDLFTIALTLAIIGYIEAISIAKKLEEKHKYYKINPNQELLALGMSNLIGSFFQSFPVTGGFSRSAVNDESGAKSGISAIISSIIVGITIIFFTSYLFYLPKAILSSIIIVAVFNLIDYKFPIKLMSNNKDEFLLLTITFLFTIFSGIKEGIIIGLFTSILIVVSRFKNGNLSIKKKIRLLINYKKIISLSKKHKKRNDILILHVKGQLFYGNLNYFKSFIKKETSSNSNFLKALVLDIKDLYYIDSSGSDTFCKIIKKLNKMNIRVMISSFTENKKDFKFDKNLIDCIKRNNLFISINNALENFNISNKKSI